MNTEEDLSGNLEFLYTPIVSHPYLYYYLVVATLQFLVLVELLGKVPLHRSGEERELRPVTASSAADGGDVLAARLADESK